MDKIFIKDLTVEAIVGVLPEERTNKQLINLSLTLCLDTFMASKTDHIYHAVNYLDISEQIRDFVKSSRFFLIETLANEVLRILFDRFPVEKATILVEKPQAISFTKSVGVELTRSREQFNYNNVYLLLGSNVDRKENLVKAVEKLKELTKINDISSVYESRDRDESTANPYYNVAIEIETSYGLYDVKRYISRVLEEFCGRDRSAISPKKVSLDCDILLFNRVIINDEDFQIPAPELLTSDFALTPLTEILPHYIHPQAEKSLQELSKEMTPYITKKFSFAELHQQIRVPTSK